MSESIIAIDTGGTFTDVVLLHDGALHVLKVPSTPDDPARAVIEAIESITASSIKGVTPQRPDVSAPRQLGALTLIHGSTVATNALLERKGARVALITNAGFEDVIEIGRQNRPQLYALTGHRPPPLVERALRFGVRGRIAADGGEIEPLNTAEIEALHELVSGANALAICLLHSYANPTHEARIAHALAHTQKHISISSELLPEYREYERTATTVVNAYVAPLMDRYLSRLEKDAGVARVRVMGSGGGAVPIAFARREPVHTILSGPAGGVAGALAAARAAGFDRIITFDMGGTSTDVSLCPGRPLHTREFTIAGLPVAIPVLDIHTVGAGGGSLAWVDAAGALHVGPQSAGAVPGPICYGAGGNSLTVTDANVWLGRLPADSFLGGSRVLQRELIEQPLQQLAQQLGLSAQAAAEGILTVVNTTMEGALRVISVERGYDPADFTLAAFGGAAGLHAAALAERLGIPRVLLPANPGVLSAFGMLVSPVRKATSRTVLRLSTARADESLEVVFSQLEAQARAAMSDENISNRDIHVGRFIDARYFGQSYELRVPAADWIQEFHRAHEARYGHADANAVVEAVTLRVEATSPEPVLPFFADAPDSGKSASGRVYYDGAWLEARVLPRSLTRDRATGPAILTEYSGTTFVPPGWQVARLQSGALLMTQA